MLTLIIYELAHLKYNHLSAQNSYQKPFQISFNSSTINLSF